MTFIEEFNNEIQGERLLYLEKDSYSKEESQLIVQTLANRVSRNLYHASLVSGFFPILFEKVLPNIDKDELKEEIVNIENEIKRINALAGPYRIEEQEYAQYSAKLLSGVSKNDSYFDMIIKTDIDASRLEKVLKNSFDLPLCSPDTDFLITANIMFSRYPDFYNEKSLGILSDMINNFDKKRILDKEELEKYKAAEKATLKHIKTYCKKAKKQKRNVQKVKKI